MYTGKAVSIVGLPFSDRVSSDSDRRGHSGLGGKFINFGILKQKSFDDCRHIAAAIIAGCDIITSWNFKHIVNVKTVRGVKTITTLEGYKDLLIYPPSVLLEGDEDDDETGRE